MPPIGSCILRHRLKLSALTEKQDLLLPGQLHHGQLEASGASVITTFASLPHLLCRSQLSPASLHLLLFISSRTPSFVSVPHPALS